MQWVVGLPQHRRRRLFVLKEKVAGYVPSSGPRLPIIMAAEGKAVMFYRCIFYFVSITERPAMGSQPNLTSRPEMVSIYKCPPKKWVSTPNLGAKTSNF